MKKIELKKVKILCSIHRSIVVLDVKEGFGNNLHRNRRRKLKAIDKG